MTERSATNEEEMLATAIAWLVRVQSDAATEADWRALTSWLEESEAHQLAFDEAERLDDAILDHRDELRIALPGPQSAVVSFSRPARRRAPAGWIAALSAAAAMLLAAPIAWRSVVGEAVTYTTARGQTREVVLSDGTHLRLDGASRVVVRMGWRARRVEMTNAQAAFDVAKDPSRPFLIDVADQQVRVVGTEFNIRQGPRDVTVTVRRGVVEVRDREREDRVVARLTRGQELRRRIGSPVSQVSVVDPNAGFAWTAGQLVCTDRPLEDVVDDLNRRFTTPVQLAGAARDRRFTGVLELGDEGVAVRNLAAFLSLPMRRTDKAFILG